MDLDVVVAKLEWIEKRQQERHEENSGRLQRIETQVTNTNGRVSRHDAEILALKVEQERIARGKMLDRQEAQDLENSPLSFKSAKGVVLLILGSLVGFYSVLTALGWHR